MWGGFNEVSLVAFQCGAVSNKFFQWCSSVPYKYSLGHPVVSQCTLGQPVTFQWHSSYTGPASVHWCTLDQPVYTGVHWTSQCTLAQGKGIYSSIGSHDLEPTRWQLSEPMINSLLTHICVTRPQWVSPAISSLYTGFVAPNTRWSLY